ncbi:hypothetical protein F0562_003390 [Nyssa sinensis]|uniref:Uncharacterized protein n=1 Tax=Nyssa sinensis TaxID=561372 RepID=A0A5J5C0H0_9ASTE|nr:hypothetical protein F0562_003390 [Nyssa sinensis]
MEGEFQNPGFSKPTAVVTTTAVVEDSDFDRLARGGWDDHHDVAPEAIDQTVADIFGKEDLRSATAAVEDSDFDRLARGGWDDRHDVAPEAVDQTVAEIFGKEDLRSGDVVVLEKRWRSWVRR